MWQIAFHLWSCLPLSQNSSSDRMRFASYVSHAKTRRRRRVKCTYLSCSHITICSSRNRYGKRYELVDLYNLRVISEGKLNLLSQIALTKPFSTLWNVFEIHTSLPNWQQVGCDIMSPVIKKICLKNLLTRLWWSLTRKPGIREREKRFIWRKSHPLRSNCWSSLLTISNDLPMKDFMVHMKMIGRNCLR